MLMQCFTPLKVSNVTLYVPLLEVQLLSGHALGMLKHAERVLKWPYR